MGSDDKLRMTPQRRMIFEALSKPDTHPSAEEIHLMVKKKLPRISLGTVYRNLELLSDMGMIQKLELGGGQKRFDGNIEHHLHIRCLRCGGLRDAPVGPLEELERAMAEMKDYQVVGYRLEFIGICPGCAGQKGAHRLKEGGKENRDARKIGDLQVRALRKHR